MDAPLVLYSASTWLAYAIAEWYYGGVHYAWCSPYYDGTTTPRYVNVPPSSSPAEIYRTFAEDTRRGDRHSRTLDQNRDGMLRGAKAKLAAGVISEADFAEIEYVVAEAELPDFRPLLFVIPFEQVHRIAVRVPAAERAHPLSLEFRIERLPNGMFDILELKR